MYLLHKCLSLCKMRANGWLYLRMAAVAVKTVREAEARHTSGASIVSRLAYLLDELDDEPVPNKNRASRHRPNDCQNVMTGRPNKPGKRPFHNHMVGNASNSATNAPRTMKARPANTIFIFTFSPTCASWRLTVCVSGGGLRHRLTHFLIYDLQDH